MPSEAALAALRDIQHHIAIATQFVQGLTLEMFQNDLRTVYAVTRCLEIISEASRRLPAELKECPSLDPVEGDGRRGQCLPSRV